MDTVSIHSINHENICCLNTALVILILAHGKASMEELLGAIKHLAKRKMGLSASARKRNGCSSNENYNDCEDRPAEGSDADDDAEDLPVCVNFRQVVFNKIKNYKYTFMFKFYFFFPQIMN